MGALIENRLVDAKASSTPQEDKGEYRAIEPINNFFQNRPFQLQLIIKSESLTYHIDCVAPIEPMNPFVGKNRDLCKQQDL